jgi:hypothetical protein
MASRAILLALWLWPLAGRAGDEIQRAQLLSLQMKYTEALQIAEGLLKNPESSPEEVRAAYEIQAMNLASLGKARPAGLAFQRLLALDPALELSPAVSPKIRAMFDKARKDNQGLQPIRLTHAPPAPGATLAGLELVATLESNPLDLVRAIRFTYFAPGGAPQRVVRPVDKPGSLAFKLSKNLDLPEIHYYFELLNEGQAPLTRVASAAEPFKLKAERAAVADSPVRKSEPLEALPPEDAPAGMPSAPLAGMPAAPLEEGQDAETAGAWYTSWWFWTVVGAVVVGGAAAGLAVGLSSGGDGGAIRYDLVIR